MIRKVLSIAALVVMIQTFGLAQDGKLRGKVTDKESGEPLVGATVSLQGTSLGASTDINGEYIVLNIPIGVHTVKASYIGYKASTVSNIRISMSITTTQDIQLVSDAVEVPAVDIVAERPLIQRNTTNTVRLTTQEDIENLPIRGVQNIIALEAGVVQQNGTLYIRGGRAGEVAFYLDGVNTTSPLTNTQTVGVIQEAIEELQLQAGGYTAEFGGGNSAILRTTLRTGQQDYHGSFGFRTDDFAKPGEEFLGSTAFGFRNAVFTLSGPLGADNFRFFLAGQHNYLRDRGQRFVVPFKFDSLRVVVGDPRFDPNLPANQQMLLPGPVEFKENYVPKNYSEANTLQGTVSYDFSPYKLRFSGTYSADNRPVSSIGALDFGSTWPDALANIFRQSRLLEFSRKTTFAEVRFNHVINTNTFYEVGASWQNISQRTYDPGFDAVSSPAPLALTVDGSAYTPTFADNWNSYSDSIANESLGYSGFRTRYIGPEAFVAITTPSIFRHPNSPNNSYSKRNQRAFGFSADVTSQVYSNYELKVGGKLDIWKVRNYTVNNISQAMRFLYGEDGNSPKTFTDEEDLRVNLAKTSVGNIDHYGYDVFGNEIDTDIDGTKNPFFASAYIQNKLEYRDLIVNFGLRFERYDTKGKTFTDANYPDSAFNLGLDILDPSKLVDAQAFNLVLPRMSFSFPVTNNTVFYAMYGRYAQLPSLNQLYVGNTVLSRTVSPASRGNAFLTPVGFLLKPERTTQYEMGFRQTLSDNFAFTMSGFYKDLKDQLAVRSYVDATGNKLFTAYLNEDFGTVKGLELTLELRRTNRFAAKVNYTMSDARGTGSNSQSAFGAIEQNIGRPTNFINPLDFNQTHKGTILLDYRFGKDDGGPVLQGFGINALLTFNSGHAYTKTKEPKELGQANPWDVGIRPLLDARSSFPAEPINASTTPWVFNIDLSISKGVSISNLGVEFFINVLNLLNTKHVLNVYPSTGTPQDDGWLQSPLASGFSSIPNYNEFYRAINLQNQWAYQSATGNEMYGTPRQVRLGLQVDF